MTAMTLSMPIGLLVAGPVSEVIGVNVWFFWSGAALIATGILCRLLSKRYDEENRKPATHCTEIGNRMRSSFFEESHYFQARSVMTKIRWASLATSNLPAKANMERYPVDRRLSAFLSVR